MKGVTTNYTVEGESLSDMKDGDLAIITDWNGNSSYRGNLVQRFGSCIVTIGKKSGESFGTILSSTSVSKYKVKILRSGEKLEITLK